jgi:hypothetical protein
MYVLAPSDKVQLTIAERTKGCCLEQSSCHYLTHFLVLMHFFDPFKRFPEPVGSMHTAAFLRFVGRDSGSCGWFLLIGH